MARNTKEKLLYHGRILLWTRGYSNVSLRQIAGAAQVDVALISRYFGSKLGLFQATLEAAFDSAILAQESTRDLTDAMVELFVTTPRDTEVPSVLRMVLANADDADVGDEVRARTLACLHRPALDIIGTPARTAMFLSVLMGVSVVEKSLKLPGVPAHNTKEYEAFLRHLLNAATTFEEKT